MTEKLPVVLLAFANARDAHLDLLKAESREVFRSLQPLQHDGKIAIHREESSEFDELYEDLLAFDGRLVIFHYGGHANGATLQFEGGGGNSKGLARLLGQQTSLKLVFLNGCATQGHVSLLLKMGVPAVIATSVPIGDKKAQEFSAAFYTALAEGRSIPEAFEAARGLVEGKYGATESHAPSFTRSLGWGGETSESPVLEWGLFTREDCAEDIERWRLPDARMQWQVKLADAQGPLRDLDGNPLSVEQCLPTRTIDGMHCKACGATAAATADRKSACFICGSIDVERIPVRTLLAEYVVPFAITEDDARDRLTKLMVQNGDKAGHTAKLQRILVPYWLFDIDTHTTLKAERGWKRSLRTTDQALDWEPVHEDIDLAFETYLVSAGPSFGAVLSSEDNWFWDLDRIVPVNEAGADAAFVPLDRDMQSAFEDLVSNLDTDLTAEIDERIGGHQQRNISADTRYRNISARTVMLPHWCTVVERNEVPTCYLVNGQTGAVRAVQPALAIYSNEGNAVLKKSRTYEPSGQREAPTLSASILSGIGIGLMVGLMLGLAAPSPDHASTVAIFIGAVGAGLAALLGLNDRHFSTGKGIRIGAFGIAVVVAAPAGIYMRDYGLFSPSLAEQKQEYLDLGYSEREALDLLANKVATLPNLESVGDVAGVPLRVASAAPSAKSYLFSSPVDVSVCGSLTTAFDEGMSTEVALGNFSRAGGAGWKALADSVSQAELLTDEDKKHVLFVARDAVCGINGGNPIRPTAQECQRIRTTLQGQSDAEVDAAFDTDDLRVIVQRIEADISAAAQPSALRLVGGTLCPEQD